MTAAKCDENVRKSRPEKGGIFFYAKTMYFRVFTEKKIKFWANFSDIYYIRK